MTRSLCAHPGLPLGRSIAPLQPYIIVPGTAYGHQGCMGILEQLIHPEMMKTVSSVPAELPDPAHNPPLPWVQRKLWLSSDRGGVYLLPSRKCRPCKVEYRSHDFQYGQ